MSGNEQEGRDVSVNDEAVDTDEDTPASPYARTREEVIPEAEAYFKRYHLTEMNVINGMGTAAWWLHHPLQGHPIWMEMLAIAGGSFVAGYLLDKLQWFSTVTALRTNKPLGGPVTNWLGWVIAVIWLPLSFMPYFTKMQLPSNFFWYMAAVNIGVSIIAGRVDKALAKR